MSRRLFTDSVLFPIIGVAVVLVGLLARNNATVIQSATYVAIYGVAAIGLSILLGNVNQISLGQAGFFAIGAYSCAFLTTAMGWSFWEAVPVAIVLSSLAGFAIGFVALRFRGHYLAMVTLAFGLIIVGVFHAVPGFGGAVGITNVPYPQLGAITLSGPAEYWFVWAIALGAGGLSLILLRGRTGYVLEAIRTDELAAEMVGIPTRRYKIRAFAYAGALAGLAGSIYAGFLGLVVPEALSVSLSIELLLMVVLGGSGTISGALVGAAFLGFLDIAGHQYANWREVAYGALVVGFALGVPTGLAGLLTRFRRRKDQSRVHGVLPALSPHAALQSVEVPLELSGVTRRFGGLIAVNEVSFALRAGTLTSLIGPNGAGKTTLFNCISGVGHADMGAIRLRGVDVTQRQPHEIIGHGVGRTFQNPRLFPEMTVLENVTVAALRVHRGAEAVAHAQATLARLGLEHLADQPASDLAFGDRRRIELARAIVANPWLLLLDEPAAGLNRSEREQLRSDLLKLRADGLTMLLVEHDVKLVMTISDRVMVLNFGQLIADGEPAVVQRDPAVISAYLGKSA